MKRSEAVQRISKKLQKQMHMINSEIQRNSPKMLCDNLALRVLTEIEEMGMLPPKSKTKVNHYTGSKIEYYQWDKDG